MTDTQLSRLKRIPLQLNYGSLALQEAMSGELRRIAARCDGVRCDMAMLVLPEVFERTWGIRVDLFWPRVTKTVHDEVPAAILGEWLVILMNVSSPIAFRFRRYVWRQQQALSQRFSILRPPLFPRTYLLRAGCG
jgi:hypothetical protein